MEKFIITNKRQMQRDKLYWKNGVSVFYASAIHKCSLNFKVL